MIYTTHTNGDEWGMVYGIAIPTLHTAVHHIHDEFGWSNLAPHSISPWSFQPAPVGDDVCEGWRQQMWNHLSNHFPNHQWLCMVMYCYVSFVTLHSVPVCFHSIPMISNFSKVSRPWFGLSSLRPALWTDGTVQGTSVPVQLSRTSPRSSHVPPPYSYHFGHGIWI